MNTLALKKNGIERTPDIFIPGVRSLDFVN
jgi:hypothetical protein